LRALILMMFSFGVLTWRSCVNANGAVMPRGMSMW
jgi:hypothetical protein